MRDLGLLIFGAGLGLIGQWLFYRYQRRNEQQQGPNVVVSKIQRGENIRVELRNLGPDTLTEMDIKFSWLHRGQRREIVVLEFYRNTDGPQRLEVLAANESVEVAGVPSTTDDGIVDVQITGLGATSQHLYSWVRQVAVALTPVK